MERITRAFRLLGASWQVLRADRELLILPVISLVCIVIATASIAGLGWATGFGRERETLEAGDYLLLFSFYFVTYFISIFFNAAVVGAATIRLQGGDPTLGDGLRLAWSRVGKIAVWAAVAATVGLILRALEERAGFLGRIVIAVVGVAWSAVTFFVVPVLLYEPVGVVDGIKRSGSIFKGRWGETFVGNAAIGVALFLVALPLVALGFAVAMAGSVVGIVLMVVTAAAVGAAGAAITGIFNAALYRYATTGDAGGAFSEADLRGSFRPKR